MGKDNLERRILHVITGLELGGAEALLIECADRGRAYGFAPLVVSLKTGGQNRRRLEERGIEVVELDVSSWASLPGKLAEFRRQVRRFRPALTQSWLYDANLFVMVAASLSRDLRRHRLVWGLFGTVPDLSSCSPRLKAMVRAGALASRYPAAIIYNAELARVDHERFGYRPRQSLVFRNFVDVDQFRPDPGAREAVRAKLGIPGEAFVAIAVGRNAWQKSWSFLLAAVGGVPGLTTLAVGPGTEHLPDQAGLIRVGPSLDMPRLYAAADIFLLASAFGEGTSVAMSEAMAASLPVVVTDVGDNGRVGQTAGFALAPGDLPGFVEAIRHLMDDVALRAAFARAAHVHATEQFSAARELLPLMQLYEGLCDARP